MKVRVAGRSDFRYCTGIARAIQRQVARGAVGMALRHPGLIREKMAGGHAIIATARGRWVGFCYVSLWEEGRFVSTSALIVRASHRRRGIARKLKEAALRLCRRRYPRSRPFGLTTSVAVVRINAELGFAEVDYSQIARDPEFWRGCESCPFHGELVARHGRSCRCRAMLAPGAKPRLPRAPSS